MYKGTVKFFNAAKGFGFIAADASKQEVFVHVTGLLDQVNEGDTVIFETKKTPRGLTAVNVKRTTI